MKKKIIFVSGTFNVIHSGHARLLRYARSLGDYLIVGVTSDKLAGKESFVHQKLRIENLKLFSGIDKVILINNLKKTILKIKPNIIVKGKEYKFIENPESDYIKKIGARLAFSSGEVVFSSTKLINKEIGLNLKNNINFSEEFIDRRKINKKKLINFIKRFKTLNVCVIGDLIVDEYIDSDLLGASAEEPSLVVRPLTSKKFIGGAGIVAAHARNLGSKTILFALIGNDKEKEFVKTQIKENKIKSGILIDSLRQTTLKKRYRVENRTLFKASYLSQNLLSPNFEKIIINNVKKIVKNLDLIVLSDFNYGCLSQNLVNSITDLAKKNKVVIAADSQSSSQIGNITRFKDLDLITPTEREARISINNNNDGLIVLADKILNKSNAKNLIMTLGPDGILINQNINNDNKDPRTVDRISAMNQYPIDVSGSGDSLLIVASMALASGASIWEASYLGSLAAAIQVSRIGNVPIRSNEIINLIKN
jgi:rfaE bifunctional protein kinase chain/domain